jgi:hypothetical protein
VLVNIRFVGAGEKGLETVGMREFVEACGHLYSRARLTLHVVCCGVKGYMVVCLWVWDGGFACLSLAE